jgi:hypothetical protein
MNEPDPKTTSADDGLAELQRTLHASIALMQRTRRRLKRSRRKSAGERPATTEPASS